MMNFRAMHPVDIVHWLYMQRRHYMEGSDEHIDMLPMFPVFTINRGNNNGQKYAYEKTFFLVDVSLERFSSVSLLRYEDGIAKDIDEDLDEEEAINSLREVDPSEFGLYLYFYDECHAFDFVDILGVNNACSYVHAEIAYSNSEGMEIIFEVCEKIEEALRRKKIITKEEQEARKRRVAHSEYQKCIEKERETGCPLFQIEIVPHNVFDDYQDVKRIVQVYQCSYTVWFSMLEIRDTTQDMVCKMINELCQLKSIESIQQMYP